MQTGILARACLRATDRHVCPWGIDRGEASIVTVLHLKVLNPLLALLPVHFVFLGVGGNPKLK
jgi:hypothetical protein